MSEDANCTILRIGPLSTLLFAVEKCSSQTEALLLLLWTEANFRRPRHQPACSLRWHDLLTSMLAASLFV
ncbi:unnamed protein product [Pleuronectes platessa]|uniref:Uncharacterized protein n=1 Tax=Pleuronectes platessa TaxID=8262 RepID=A0A9N7VV76_PLEPL|nr:unnamed protein product [Pleuronectes platessa]